MGSGRRSRYLVRTASGIGVLAAAYALAAYLLMPALWSRYEHQPGLAPRPLLTVTGIPGDPLNVGLVGSREEVVGALAKAGWHAADPITFRSSLEIGVSEVLSRSYPGAPVSSLFYEGRRQDLAFEMPVGASPAARHHVRLWQVLPRGTEGRDLWLGAASFDRRVGLSHDTGQITHHIDPDLDAERTYFVRSLEAAGALSRTYLLPGAGPATARAIAISPTGTWSSGDRSRARSGEIRAVSDSPIIGARSARA